MHDLRVIEAMNRNVNRKEMKDIDNLPYWFNITCDNRAWVERNANSGKFYLKIELQSGLVSVKQIPSMMAVSIQKLTELPGGMASLATLIATAQER